MNSKLLASVPLCAALLSGCSSPPKLTVPSGQWVDINQPGATSPITPLAPSARPTLPAVAVTAPVANAAGAAPPKTPVVISTEVTSVSPWGTPPAPYVTAPPNPTPVSRVSTTGQANAPVPAPVTPHRPNETPTVAAPKTFAAPSTPPVAARTSSVPAVAKPAPIPKQVWEARVGESLRTVIKGWSQRVNYHVEWEVEDLDYPIDAPLRFEGSYEQALASIFDLYKQADRSFIVDGHREQKRLNVTEDHRKRNTRSPL